MLSAQTPSSEWSPFPCPNLPLVLPQQPGFRGSAVTDVSLSLRLFPQAHRASLSGTGDAQAKRIWLHVGLLHRAVETSSGKQQAASHRPDSDFPKMLCFPRGDDPAKRLSLYAGFSHLLRVLC